MTIKDIAAKCGVSIGSVDRALHNRKGINTETRELILETARSLGYVPNLAARGLVTGKTMVIGLIVFDLAHAYFAELVTAAISRLSERGYFAHVTVSDKDPERERLSIRQMSSLGVDGLLLTPIGVGPWFDSLLATLNRPVVTVANYIGERWPYVGIDYARATEDAVEFLVRQGYGRIIFLSPPLRGSTGVNTYAIDRRLAGFKSAMDSHPTVDAPIIDGPQYLDRIERLDLAAARTAVLCSSDVYALKVLTFFTSKGVRVPDDVGIMGFDNIGTLAHVHPALATVDTSIESIGIEAADTLLDSIRGQSVSKILPHRIIPGETV